MDQANELASEPGGSNAGDFLDQKQLQEILYFVNSAFSDLR